MRRKTDARPFFRVLAAPFGALLLFIGVCMMLGGGRAEGAETLLFGAGMLVLALTGRYFGL